jgi:hypothetical protein
MRAIGALAHQPVAAHDNAVYCFRRRRVTGTQFETGVDYGNSTTPHR